jgi:hypothetical protein
VIYVSPKNLALLMGLLSNHNNGIHAIKMSKVNDDVGHAAHNKIPLANDRRRLVYRFNVIIYVKIGVVCDADKLHFHKNKNLWNRYMLTSKS